MKTKTNLLTLFKRAMMASSALLLAGCATTKDNVDPYEKYNRVAFKFNRGVDYVVVRPIADLYDTLTPIPIQGGISRMYTNFYEPSRVINDILQGEGLYACQDGARFIVNTTVGLAGFFDVAQSLGYPVHQQDFGITMARWGWNQSAYFVMPFMGIYTVRDFAAVPFNNYAFTFWPYVQPESLAWQLYFLELIQIRTTLRPTDKVIDEAFDPYLFVRDAYLQKRQHDINNQRNGRKQEVKPEPEQAGEKAVADKRSAPETVKNNLSAHQPSKKSTGKSLPDVLSLKKNVSHRII